ncbi:MAG: hypothetical protein AAGJ50_09150 [Pseudomonadota bacterium]
MSAAWRAGEINQILLVFLPLFAVCIVSFAATSWIRAIVGNWWTVRTAVRSGFYMFGALIGIISVGALAVSQLDLSDELAARLSMAANFGILALFLWYFFGFLKAGGVEGNWRLFSAAMLATIFNLVVINLTVLLFF